MAFTWTVVAVVIFGVLWLRRKSRPRFEDSNEVLRIRYGTKNQQDQ